MDHNFNYIYNGCSQFCVISIITETVAEHISKYIEYIYDKLLTCVQTKLSVVGKRFLQNIEYPSLQLVIENLSMVTDLKEQIQSLPRYIEDKSAELYIFLTNFEPDNTIYYLNNSDFNYLEEIFKKYNKLRRARIYK